jgi:FtsZ-binding cell division protein ZapB
MSDAELIERLCQEVEELRRENAELGRENADLRRDNAELRRRLAEAMKENEQWRRGHRERSKRRCSRPEGSRRPSTGRARGGQPGHRGSNRPVPDRIDHTVDHPLPTHCDCGGEVEDTGETQSTIVQDIPPVQVVNTRHVGHIGKCKRCGRRIVSKLPGMSSAGDASAQVQLGPNAAAMALELRFDITFRSEASAGCWAAGSACP